MRCFVSSCLVMCSMRCEILKLMPFIRVGIRLTFASAYATRHLEKPLFFLLHADANTHKYVDIGIKTCIVLCRAQKMENGI